MLGINNIKKNPFSIIDIGSFSIRLVIYDSLSLASRTLFNEKVICNLGEIVNQKGIFTVIKNCFRLGFSPVLIYENIFHDGKCPCFEICFWGVIFSIPNCF